MSDLTAAEWIFIAEYLRDRNGARAIRVAGYEGNRAGETAWEWRHRPAIKAELDRTFAAMREGAYKMTKDMVQNDIVNVLNADPRELFNVQVGACRYCHGVGHQYQSTVGEMRRDQQAFYAKQPDGAFDMRGGIGFDAYADPHPECPECNGHGVDRIRLRDTRTLSPEAASLLLSIEQTKHGVKITTRSKDTAREAAARLLGMNKDTLDVTVRKVEEMTDEELAALIEKEKGQ